MSSPSSNPKLDMVSETPLTYNEAETLTEPAPNPCPICGCDYGSEESKEEACILYCGHIFGLNCITDWVETSPNHDCPTCRRTQLHSCVHGCRPRPLDRHPPIAENPADMVLPPLCFSCYVESCDYSEIEREMATDTEYLEAERRHRENLIALGVDSGPEWDRLTTLLGEDMSKAFSKWLKRVKETRW